MAALPAFILAMRSAFCSSERPAQGFLRSFLAGAASASASTSEATEGGELLAFCLETSGADQAARRARMSLSDQEEKSAFSSFREEQNWTHSVPRLLPSKPASRKTPRTRSAKRRQAVGARGSESELLGALLRSFLGAGVAEGFTETSPSRVEMRPFRVFISLRS